MRRVDAFMRPERKSTINEINHKRILRRSPLSPLPPLLSLRQHCAIVTRLGLDGSLSFLEAGEGAGAVGVPACGSFECVLLACTKHRQPSKHARGQSHENPRMSSCWVRVSRSRTGQCTPSSLTFFPFSHCLSSLPPSLPRSLHPSTLHHPLINPTVADAQITQKYAEETCTDVH